MRSDFNIQADDKVVMLFPRRNMPEHDVVEAGMSVRFPPSPSLVLEMGTLEGHEVDTEAFMVVAIPAGGKDRFQFAGFFEEDKPYSVPDFFERYSRFAEKAVEKILPYEVRKRVGK